MKMGVIGRNTKGTNASGNKRNGEKRLLTCGLKSNLKTIYKQQEDVCVQFVICMKNYFSCKALRKAARTNRSMKD